MAKQDEISSTERLLNLIRSKGADQPAATDATPARPSKKPKRTLTVKRLVPGKNAILGVDFGSSSMRLALVNKTADKTSILTKQGVFAYQKDLSIHSPRFPIFLKPILDEFCRSYRKVKIWSTITSTNVDTRHVQIPKVPKKQVASTVFWTYRKESQFNEKESIFDFETLGDTVERGKQRTNVLCYTAPRPEVENLKRIFSKTGYTLAGVSIVPFAVQNLFRSGWTETGGKSVCTLFIGTDWSRISIFSDKNLILCRDIKSGLQSMIEAIAEDMEQMHPELAMPEMWP